MSPSTLASVLSAGAADGQISSNAAGDLIIGTMTIRSGASTIVQGHTLSVGKGGIIVIDGRTLSLPHATATVHGDAIASLIMSGLGAEANASSSRSSRTTPANTGSSPTGDAAAPTSSQAAANVRPWTRGVIGFLGILVAL